VPAPKVAADYNNNMGAVDQADALRASASAHRKSVKWWHAVWYWIMDVARINAMIIYNCIMKQRKVPTLSAVAFAEALIQEMLVQGGAGDAAARSRTAEGFRNKRVRVEIGAAMPPLRLTQRGKHWPKELPGKKRLRCKLCYHKEGTKATQKTRYVCTVCEVALCVTCFQPYHEQ
jgi:hypothetical protein